MVYFIYCIFLVWGMESTTKAGHIDRKGRDKANKLKNIVGNINLISAHLRSLSHRSLVASGLILSFHWWDLGVVKFFHSKSCIP